MYPTIAKSIRKRFPRMNRHTASAAVIVFAAVNLHATSLVAASSTVQRRAINATGWVFRQQGGPVVGTCWLVDREQRLAMTCWHVAPEGSEVDVYFPQYRNGARIQRAGYYKNRVKPIKARCVRANKENDLAVLQLERIPNGVRAFPLGPTAASGDAVTVVGHPVSGPAGDLWQARSGVVKAAGFMANVSKLTDETLFQTMYWGFNLACDIEHGMSGSAVINEHGQAVGCVSVQLATQRTGVAIGVGEIRKMLGLHFENPVMTSPTSPLVGCWGVFESTNGRLSGASGYGLLDDGTFYMTNATGVQSGQYAVHGDRITFSLNGRRLFTGRIRWDGDDAFHLVESNLANEISFRRDGSLCQDQAIAPVSMIPATENKTLPEHWHRTVSNRGAFRIDFPLRPQLVSDLDGTVEYTCTRQLDGVRFGVMASEIPAHVKEKHVPSALVLDAMAKASQSALDLQCLRSSDQTYANFPGRSDHLRGTVNGQPVSAEMRGFLTDTHYYQLRLIAPTGLDLAEDRAAFFDSFSTL